jgi:YgiT-type zinc finger domain-containing protein
MLDTCPNCQIGQLKPVRTTYVQVYNYTLVQVPNVTAWKCDVCALSFFDPSLIRRLELLIGDAGPPPNHHTPTAPDIAPHIRPPAPGDDPPDEARPHSEQAPNEG